MPTMLGDKVISGKIIGIRDINSVMESCELFRQLVDPTVAAEISVPLNPAELYSEVHTSISDKGRRGPLGSGYI